MSLEFEPCSNCEGACEPIFQTTINEINGYDRLAVGVASGPVELEESDFLTKTVLFARAAYAHTLSILSGSSFNCTHSEAQIRQIIASELEE